MNYNQVPPQIQGAAETMIRKLLESGLQSGYMDQNQASFIFNEWTNNGYGVLVQTLQKYPNGTLNEQQLFNVMEKFVQRARGVFFSNPSGGYFNNSTPGWNGAPAFSGFGGSNFGGGGSWGPRWNGNNNGVVNHAINNKQSFFSNGDMNLQKGNDNPYAGTSSAPAQPQQVKKEEPVETTLENQISSEIQVNTNYSKPTVRRDVEQIKFVHGDYDFEITGIENQNHTDIAYIEGSVNKGYLSALEAVTDVIGVLPVNIDHKFASIIYNKLFYCDAPRNDLVEMITGLKELANDVTKKNKLSYIESIRKYLDKFNRGIADTVEQIFVNEFNKRTAAGEAMSSDEMTPDAYSFTVNNLKEISEYIASSDKPEIKAKQNIKGFKEKVSKIARETIIGTIIDMEICDPQTKSDIADIIKVCRSVSIDDTPVFMLPELETELKTATAAVKKTAEYASKAKTVASIYDFMNTFGVIRLRNQKVCFTTLSFVGFVQSVSTVKYGPICIGGEPDDDISYLITSRVITQPNHVSELIIQPTPNTFVSYMGVVTTDNWIRFSPLKIMK